MVGDLRYSRLRRILRPGDSGRGAVWLARLNGVQKVAGSNLVAPTCKAFRSNELRKAFFIARKWGEAAMLRPCYGRKIFAWKRRIAPSRKRKPPAPRVGERVSGGFVTFRFGGTSPRAIFGLGTLAVPAALCLPLRLCKFLQPLRLCLETCRLGTLSAGGALVTRFPLPAFRTGHVTPAPLATGGRA